MYTVSTSKCGKTIMIHAHGRANVSVLVLERDWTLRLSSVDLGRMSVYAILNDEDVVEFAVFGDQHMHPHAGDYSGRMCIGTYPETVNEVWQCIWDYFNGSGVNPFDCYRTDMFRPAECDDCSNGNVNIASVIPVMCVDPNLVAAVATEGVLDYAQHGMRYERHLLHSGGDISRYWKIGGYHRGADAFLCLDCLVRRKRKLDGYYKDAELCFEYSARWERRSRR